MNDDLYKLLTRRIWRDVKLVAVAPTISIGEFIGLLMLQTYKPTALIAVPVILTWLLWRGSRDSDTRPQDGDAKQGPARE